MRLVKFFLQLTPPAGTAQQRKINFRQHRTYLPKRVVEARKALTALLADHSPEEPLAGELRVIQRWYYPVPASRRKKGIAIQRKTTTGDCDNIAKLLNDCMTLTGYWYDDRQIYSLTVEKYYVDPEAFSPGIEIVIEET